MAKTESPSDLTPEQRKAAAEAASRVESKGDEPKVAAAVAADAEATAKELKDSNPTAAAAAVKAAEVVEAFVRQVPNSGKLYFNGAEITLPPQGEKVKVPRAFVLAFPNYLSA